MIQDPQTKEAIINYLYKTVNISNQKYQIMKTVSEIQPIKSKKYYLSVNSVGMNSILFFKKINGINISCRIDRRTISLKDRKYVNMNEVKMIPIKYHFPDDSIYDGTIFDGIASDNGTLQSDDNVTFLITDIFTAFGEPVINNHNYKQKMRKIAPLFNNPISINNIEIMVLKVFELNQIKELFEGYLRKNQRKLNIKGIIFFPEFSGEKLIYVFDREDEKTKQEIIGQEQVNAVEATKTKAVATTVIDGETVDNEHLTRRIYELTDSEITEKIILCFEMHKTSKPDVYNIYAIQGGNKTFIDIVYINTYQLSLDCKNIFKNKEIANVLCSYNSHRKKWTPIEETMMVGASVSNIDLDRRLKLHSTAQMQ